MKPAGSAADGWHTVNAGFKDTTDLAVADDPFVSFLNANLKAAALDTSNSLYGTGYYYAYTYVEALRIAAELPGGLTRTNLVLAVRTLDIDHPHPHRASRRARNRNLERRQSGGAKLPARLGSRTGVSNPTSNRPGIPASAPKI